MKMLEIKILKKKDKKLKNLKRKDKEMLIEANGNLLQQISVEMKEILEPKPQRRRRKT